MKLRIIDRKKDRYTFEVQKKNIFFWETIETFMSLEKAQVYAQSLLKPEVVWESE